MNLAKLFETQKILRDRINYDEPDRFDKLVLALLVEIGECANEWRGFKFWSTDQKPRIKILCVACAGVGEVYHPIDGTYIECPHCEGEGLEESKNPLLEEYVDGLHFVLELGIEKNYHATDLECWLIGEENTVDSFLDVYESVLNFELEPSKDNYERLLFRFLELGTMLGFTGKEIEQAYFVKNAINHQRQEDGY